MKTYKSRLPDDNNPLGLKIERGNGLRRLRLNRSLAGNMASGAKRTVKRRRGLALLQDGGKRTPGTRENNAFAMMVKADYKKQVQLREDRHRDCGGESRSMFTVMDSVSQRFLIAKVFSFCETSLRLESEAGQLMGIPLATQGKPQHSQMIRMQTGLSAFIKPLSSKHPPAEPGALEWAVLKGAWPLPPRTAKIMLEGKPSPALLRRAPSPVGERVASGASRVRGISVLTSATIKLLLPLQQSRGKLPMD